MSACGTFSTPQAELMGRSPLKCETQCQGQTSVHVQNFSQIHSAVFEQVRPDETNRQTPNLISLITIITLLIYITTVTSENLVTLSTTEN